MMEENDDTIDEPYHEAEEFGFKSSLFLTNAG